jgi:uncharacterized damage-inducible protein DinB
VTEADQKSVLLRYLRQRREVLVWKLDGLDERAVRLPRTPTGTTLLGILKHCANVELGYFGETFGRPWPGPADPSQVAEETYETDPQADWYVPVEVSTAEVVAFARRVWAFADETIESRPLDAVGHVPWWGPDNTVSLHQILVHVLDDVSRHAGHADILRELADGATGRSAGNSNVPDLDWPAYVAELTAIADHFGRT